IEGLAREALEQTPKMGLQASLGHRQAVRRQGPRVPPVSQSEAPAQEIQHRLWESSGGSGGGFQELLGPSDQMPQTLLMAGAPEELVGRPAVVGDPAGPASSQNLDQDVVSAAVSDDE